MHPVLGAACLIEGRMLQLIVSDTVNVRFGVFFILNEKSLVAGSPVSVDWN